MSSFSALHFNVFALDIFGPGYPEDVIAPAVEIDSQSFARFALVGVTFGAGLLWSTYRISTCPSVPVFFPSMYSSVFDNCTFIYESTLMSWPWYSVWPHFKRMITGSLTLQMDISTAQARLELPGECLQRLKHGTWVYRHVLGRVSKHFRKTHQQLLSLSRRVFTYCHVDRVVVELVERVKQRS